MKKHLSQLLLLIPLLLIAAGIASAYTAPIDSSPEAGTDAPIDVGATNQAKGGGLSVNAFLARGNTLIVNHAIFNGIIRGGTPADIDSTVSFGDSANSVSVTASGSATIKGHYQSDSLKTGGGKKPVCADNNGVLYLCN